MATILLTQEAYKALYEMTAREVPGPFVSSDLALLTAEITTEVEERLKEFQRTGETLSDTVLRLCALSRLLRMGE